MYRWGVVLLSLLSACGPSSERSREQLLTRGLNQEPQALQALGTLKPQQRDPEVERILGLSLQSPSVATQRAAIRALLKRRSVAALPTILEALSQAPSVINRRVFIYELGRVEGPEAQTALRGLLQAPEPETRSKAALALAKRGEALEPPLLESLLQSSQLQPRLDAARILGLIPGSSGRLCALARDEALPLALRTAALNALSAQEAGGSCLLEALATPYPELRKTATLMAMEMGLAEAEGPLIEQLKRGDPEEQILAARALARLSPEGSQTRLERELQEASGPERAQVQRALDQLLDALAQP